PIPWRGSIIKINRSTRAIAAPLWLFMALSLAAQVVSAQPAMATTRTVTTTADSGSGSLRQAVLDSAPGDTIVFSTVTFGTPQTVLLSAAIEISRSVTIDGSTVVFTPTLSGGASSGVFNINADSTLSITRLSLANSQNSNGGAVNVAPFAAAVMAHLVFNNNSATLGGAIYNDGRVVMTDTVLMSNTAVYGGAIYNRGALSAQGIVVMGNTALYGGAIRNYGIFGFFTPTLQVNRSAIYNNSATSGGGINSVSPAIITITNTTIAGNIAQNVGGGIFNGTEVVLRLVNSTIYSNTALFSGGGITSTGEVSAVNTIFSNNAGGNCAISLGYFHDLGNNLENTNTCGLGAYAQTHSLVNTNARLGQFGLNAPGFVPTVPLQRGSPAINAGLDTACPSTDARGVVRPQGGRCDIGAYEAFGRIYFMPMIKHS
ncbi:MAG TPA: choice-of-anchor Q domain-containing protein, partial [Anaerolineae bacterium]